MDVSPSAEQESLTAPTSQTGLPPVPQAVVQSLTKAAIFLVATINSGGANRVAVRSFSAICRDCCVRSVSAT